MHYSIPFYTFFSIVLYRAGGTLILTGGYPNVQPEIRKIGLYPFEGENWEQKIYLMYVTRHNIALQS